MFDPKDGYIRYIVNPVSGSKHGKVMADQFRTYLEGRGFEIRETKTQSLAHACAIAEEAAVDYDCVVVVAAGGDGTIREVAHGLEGSEKPLLIIAEGTENLLAHELGFDDKTETLIEAFEHGGIKDLDLGCVNGQCFTSITGVGFDGEVVKLVSDGRDGHITHRSYFIPLWKTFWGHKFPKFKVTVDDEEIFSGRGMVFVGNISRYAIGLQLIKYANYSDGLLDMCIFKCSNKFHLLKHAFMTLLKHNIGGSDTVYRQCRKARVIAEGEHQATQIDGDPGPEAPLEFEVIPRAVRAIAPPDSHPAGVRTRFLRWMGWR